MTSHAAASDARQTAFEQAITAAGQELRDAIDAAGTDKAAKDDAWYRYGDAQKAAGDAFRAAQDAEAAS